MPRNSRAWRSVSALVLAFFLACSCSDGGQGSTAADIKPAARTTAPPDAFTCASVQALLGHLAAGTARWSPKSDPFDKSVAAQIRSTSVSLQRSLQKVRTVAVLRAVSSNAKAFHAVATAMSLKKRAKVNRAIAATQVAYGKFKRVCGTT
jgi:hypothetical protein